MAAKHHLVARCPFCERPVWQKSLTALLGLTPFARRFPEVAFVAVTRGVGQGKGWKPSGVLRTLAEVGNAAGSVAVDQLRKLSRQAFQRMWLQGLLTQQDVAEVMATRSFERPADAVLPTIDKRPYNPWQQFPHQEVSASVAASALPGRVVPPIEKKAFEL